MLLCYGSGKRRAALVVDNEKPRLNVEVDKACRDCLRILWVEDVRDTVVESVEYRFLSVIFGLNYSPFLSDAILQHHLDSFVKEDPRFVMKLKNCLMYSKPLGQM